MGKGPTFFLGPDEAHRWFIERLSTSVQLQHGVPVRHSAIAGAIGRMVAQKSPERCRDCGLSLAPHRALYCTSCAPAHLPK